MTWLRDPPWNGMERRKDMKNLIRLLAVVVAGTLAVIPAAPALAAPAVGDIVTLSTRFYASTLPSIVTGTLNCPAGDRLVGSGGGNARMIRAEYPTTSFTGATIVAEVDGTPPNNFVLITITCAPASEFSGVFISAASPLRAQPGTFSTGVARCPANYWAFGGGGYFSSFGSAWQGSAYSPSANAPSADGNAWTFAGVIPTGANELDVVTQCLPRSGHDFINQFGPPSTDANTITAGYADCPAGYTPVAGGFYVSNPNGTETFSPAVFPVWSVPTTHNGVTAWYASGYVPVNTKMVALAQCLI